MMTTLYYSGESFGLQFNPFYLQMIQQAYKDKGIEIDLVQDCETYDFKGIPADNVYNENYQQLIRELQEYDPSIDLKSVKVDFSNYPCKDDIMGLPTALGCRYHCALCPISNMGYIIRDLSVVKEELSDLCKKVKYFEFYDNNVLANPNFFNIIKDIPRGVTWGALINITEVTPELFRNLHRMYYFGCRNIYFGLETFNSKDLEYFKKPYYLAGVDPKKWMQTLQSIGFNLLAFIIRGLPNEKPGELDELMKYLEQHNIKYSINRFNINGDFVSETDYLSREYLASVLESDYNKSRENFRNFIQSPLQ